jgi:hypothetical protein
MFRRDFFLKRRGLSGRRSSRTEPAPFTAFEFARSLGALLAIALAVTFAMKFALFLSGQ